MQSCSLRLLPLLAAGLAACHSVTAPRSSLVGPGTGTQDGMQPYDTCLVTQRLLLPDGASAAHAGRPFGIALSSSRTAFVTLSEHRRLARAELAGAAGGGPAFSQTIAVGAAPTDVALNSRGTRAYVTNRFGGSISIVDVALNRTIGTLGLAGKPWRVKVAPGDSILWATNDAGGIYAYRLSTGHQVAALQAHQPVNGVAVGGNGHAWFGLRNGTVVEVDTRTYRVSRTFTVGGYPQDVALSPDGRQLYVANALGMV
ncbi:MAG TPA: YncE family protein, partial [Gemmatimonadales bacterium]|nr:YncE family protein [Gemmatimonadales bacterium]